ncbi:MAG: acetate--CoA ligase family protein [Chroococcus sp. CMT-3BRIN-NPC107]|nr:acetate--CoA ligase family protein [Chroococcus sp. CMT-3BRIN-NPC107]
MVQARSMETVRVNARKSDAFDIFNLKHYQGANPYLETGALVFSFALTGYEKPLEIEEYLQIIGDYYPQMLNVEGGYNSYAQLFARTVAEVGQLDMGLHLDKWSCNPGEEESVISVQSLHARTSRSVVYFVWDWFEAMTQNQSIMFDEQIRAIQDIFRRSVYGGPTVYALLRTAAVKDIPTFYLWDEGLMQYGYGKKQVRGIATTFDSDSHIDSDFTTRKDDCKAFLNTLGFPVPTGSIVTTRDEAISVAKSIGYPVAVKPVVGHKGIGVTADVQDSEELKAAFSRAVKAIPDEQLTRVIVETSVSGADFRLLCVNGRFVAATERRPAWVEGDGRLSIDELIERENRTKARRDTPTSALSKIQRDEAMELFLEEQGLTLDSVIEKGRIVYLRKVANLSAGGVSIDATSKVHPDNIVLAQDIAQHFRLTCLGIDAIAQSLSKSWKAGGFGILEINSAPGIFMHLNPATGESVDVPARILETFFASDSDAKIPLITFNLIGIEELEAIIDHILLQHPDWTIGAVCKEGVFINRSEKNLNKDYNSNVQNLLRNPKLDLLIAEYQGNILEREGMFYTGSNIVILDNPTDVEGMLARDVRGDGILVIKENNSISIKRQGLIEQYELGENEPFSRVYLKEIATIL